MSKRCEYLFIEGLIEFIEALPANSKQNKTFLLVGNRVTNYDFASTTM
jgi:hypothetical protein